MKKLNDENFGSFVEKGETMIQFSATWCGPCKALTATLESASDLRVEVGKIDIDESPATAASFGIRAVPTMIVFKDGEVVGRKSGALSLPRINDFLEESLT